MNTYVFKLFIAGRQQRLDSAIAGLRRVLDKELGNNYQLLIYDVNDDPQIAEDAKILATPTLVREQPLPVRRIIGDLSDGEKVLVGLDLPGAAPKGDEK